MDCSGFRAPSVAFVLAFLLTACSGGGSSTAQNVAVTPAPPPLQAAPDPVALAEPAAPTSAEVSVSETAMQTNIEAAPATQSATSVNYQTENAIEAVMEEVSTSEQYTAANTIQLVYGAG